MPWDTVLHRWHAGTLKSSSGKPVRSQAQAVAIMLSEKAAAGRKPEYRAAGGKRSMLRSAMGK